MTTSILLIGDSPPPGAAPDFRPFNCASGTRLATIMLGLRGREELLAHVPRTNIFDAPTGPPGCPKWWPDAAVNAGRVLLRDMPRHVTTVVAEGVPCEHGSGVTQRLTTIEWARKLGRGFAFSENY